MSMLLLCFILAHHSTNSDFNRGKKKKIKFVIVIVCLSQVLAKVMKLCAIKV